MIAAGPHPIYSAAIASRDTIGQPVDYSQPSRWTDRNGSPCYWLGLADTAKLVRATLARAFPAGRFYVRSESYAGGSSITVSYDGIRHDARGRALLQRIGADDVGYGPLVPDDEVDYSAGPRWAHVPKDGAPRPREVEAIVGAFAGRGFDGMIDSGYTVLAWLNPDGSATFAHRDATTGSITEANGSRTDPGAILMHPGAGFVFVNDDLPYDVRHKARR